MNEFTFQSQTAHSTYLELERKKSSEDEPCRDQEVEWAERCHVARHTPLHPPPSFSSLSLHTLTHTTNEMKCSLLQSLSAIGSGSSISFNLSLSLFFFFFLGGGGGSDWAKEIAMIENVRYPSLKAHLLFYINHQKVSQFLPKPVSW